ncbi:MAG: hypothetical protein WDN49_17815 [Acetobacteraceae bacterium]
MEALQEDGGVLGVCLRVERLIQCGERIRMMHEVDLHAADIDGADAGRLSVLYRSDRFSLAVEEISRSSHVDCPRPWRNAPALRVGSAALNHADRIKQARAVCCGTFLMSGLRLCTLPNLPK